MTSKLHGTCRILWHIYFFILYKYTERQGPKSGVNWAIPPIKTNSITSHTPDKSFVRAYIIPYKASNLFVINFVYSTQCTTNCRACSWIEFRHGPWTQPTERGKKRRKDKKKLWLQDIVTKALLILLFWCILFVPLKTSNRPISAQTKEHIASNEKSKQIGIEHVKDEGWGTRFQINLCVTILLDPNIFFSSLFVLCYMAWWYTLRLNWADYFSGRAKQKRSHAIVLWAIVYRIFQQWPSIDRRRCSHSDAPRTCIAYYTQHRK